MDSKRRMMELHIWGEPYFSELDSTLKLFHWFVLCKCDNVGVYRHNPRLAAFHVNDDVDLEEYLHQINFDEDRVANLSHGRLWIRNFVRDTWGTIAAKNNLGLSCYKLLVKHDLLDRFIGEYPNCINIPSFREAIQENQKGYGDLPLPQTSPSPAPNLGTAGTINITNNINDSISISNTTPAEGQEAGSYADAADRCLKAWSGRSDEVYFTEQILLEDYIKEMCEEGESLEDVESGIVGYLQAEKGNGSELIEVLESITNQ